MAHTPIHRKSGVVAIAGRPNAGKSTLLNQILGTRLSIVTPKAQTTRDRLRGILTHPEGQAIFIDTPGIHRAKEESINSYMVEEARLALDTPSLIWYVVDPESAWKHEERVVELIAKAQSPVFIVMNKTDEGRNLDLQSELLEKLDELKVPIKGAFQVSAKSGKGVPKLLKKTWELLPEGPAYYPDGDVLTDRPMRYFVAEKIREQLYLHLGQELPYSCAVEIHQFDEKQSTINIGARIHVERPSQKGMVIGAKGSKIKAIGQAARQEIESLLQEAGDYEGDRKVYLGLQVQVLKDWTKNRNYLERLGYNLPPAVVTPPRRKTISHFQEEGGVA